MAVLLSSRSVQISNFGEEEAAGANNETHPDTPAGP